jgi:FixJ family two-component response regulator
MARVPLIAIVDDDDSLRTSLANLIRSVGFEPRGFASAEAFLGSKIARHTACLILDVRLAGMNGLDLQRHMVAANWRIPIVFVTSHADDDLRARALGAGALGFLYKPFREEELLGAMGAAFSSSRHRGS